MTGLGRRTTNRGSSMESLEMEPSNFRDDVSNNSSGNHRNKHHHHKNNPEEDDDDYWDHHYYPRHSFHDTLPLVDSHVRDGILLEPPPPSVTLKGCSRCLVGVGGLILFLVGVSFWTPTRKHNAQDNVSCRRFPERESVMEKAADLKDTERCWHGSSVCTVRLVSFGFIVSGNRSRTFLKSPTIGTHLPSYCTRPI